MTPPSPRVLAPRPLLALACLASSLVALPLPALAQPKKNEVVVLEPPAAPTWPSGGANIWIVGIAILVGGLVVGVSLIPSKRGHQD